VSFSVIGSGLLNETSNVLEVVEGEEINIVCSARKGFPEPSFYWDYSSDNEKKITSQEKTDKSISN